MGIIKLIKGGMDMKKRGLKQYSQPLLENHGNLTKITKGDVGSASDDDESTTS